MYKYYSLFLLSFSPMPNTLSNTMQNDKQMKEIEEIWQKYQSYL